ncbi:RloB family protein [Streptomyces barkulensis]|uniref:RloB family protein n=1 Tax=Streptomyces barkulensis TaxID=1257026 RepID=UPI000C6D38C3|nr:RloB family protein [Streptomyces barkulensis]
MSRDKKERERRRRRERTPGGPPRRPVASYGDRSHRVLYIACEGARTEPAYLDLLNEAYGRQRSGERAFHLHYCDPGHADGLRPEEAVDQVLSVAGPGDEKWVLFDRDTEDNRDGEIPRALRKAHRGGVQVALSHPSFELWLLLHFKNWTSRENGRSATVVNELRRHRDADGFADYDKGSGDRGKGLGGKRGASLLGREANAVRNARGLVTQCSHGACSAKAADGAAKTASTELDQTPDYAEWAALTGHAPDCDPLGRDPSTDVWRLLTALGIGTDRA